MLTHTHVVSSEDVSDVTFDLDRTLLYYDGDNVTVFWNPTSFINPILAPADSFSVDVQVLWYSAQNNSWNLLADIAGGLNNSGVASNLDPFTGPLDVSDYVVPIAFRIVPRIENNSQVIPEYLLPFFERGEVSVWSSVAFKVVRSDQEARLPELCQNSISSSNRTAEEILNEAVPCPCSIRQARRVNSGFVEHRSHRQTVLLGFFNPDAQTCFASVVLR